MKKNGNNESGIYPLEFKVLIKQDDISKTTDGGIWIPDQTREKQMYAQEIGTLIALGGNAFVKDWTEKEVQALKPGARVMINKYAGAKVRGLDGQFYQLCNDKDVTALIAEGVTSE